MCDNIADEVCRICVLNPIGIVLHACLRCKFNSSFLYVSLGCKWDPINVQQLVSESCPLNEPNSLKEILEVEHMASKSILKEFLGKCQLDKNGELEAYVEDL